MFYSQGSLRREGGGRQAFGGRTRIVAGTTYIGDNAKAKRELGFDPRPLRLGLAEALRWEMAQLGERG